MKFVCAVFVSLFVVGSVFAQAPTAPVPVPALDAASKAKLDTVQRAAQVANTSCQALDAVKVYNDIRSLVHADLELNTRLHGELVDVHVDGESEIDGWIRANVHAPRMRVATPSAGTKPRSGSAVSTRCVACDQVDYPRS